MTQTPQWRFSPEPIWVLCEDVREVDDFKEFIVNFRANGKQCVSFVPERFVNLDAKLLQGYIIADVAGGVLVDIPAETLTSGARILVQDSEREQVLASDSKRQVV